MRKLRLSVCLLLLSLAGGVAASAVDFELPDLKGRTHKLSDYRGKWVVVNYWATWCPPCLEEIPELEIFHSNHKDKDAVVLGVNMEDIGEQVLSQFIADQYISYPILRTMPARSSELGRIGGMPTSYLVNPAGEVVARQVGSVSAADLEQFISNYNKQPGK
jgi:thiol-disulfide isomerase/thioredoxin